MAILQSEMINHKRKQRHNHETKQKYAVSLISPAVSYCCHHLGTAGGEHAICKAVGYCCVARNSGNQFQPPTNERPNEYLLSPRLSNVPGWQLHECEQPWLPRRPGSGDSIREPGLAIGNAAVKWSDG
jgi:hypothetical protein